MSYQLYPAYHSVGPQLITDVPTTPPTHVSVSLTPALYTEAQFPDSFAYSCILHSTEELPLSKLEEYIGAATEAIGKLVIFSAFPFSSPDDKAMVAFSPKDVEVKPEGGHVIPFSIMLKPAKDVFMNAVTIIDMQAAAIEGARNAGVLTAPSLVDSLLSTPPVVTH